MDGLARDKMDAYGGLKVTTSYKTEAQEESALQELERLMDQGKDLNGSPTKRNLASKAESDIKSPREPLSPRGSDQGSVMDPEEEWSQRCNRPFFDVFTIRQWFMEMDTDRSGHVTKQEFMDFLRNRPRLRRLFIDAGKQRRQQCKGDATQITDRQAEALEMRRLLKLLKEIDEDGNGTLEFEEFVDFWRVSGFLLEYDTPNNPREQIAEVLGQLHEGQGNGATSDPQLNFTLSTLGKNHLSSGARRKSHDLTNATGEPLQTANVGGNRRCSEPCMQGGRLALLGGQPQGLSSSPMRLQASGGRRASDSSVILPPLKSIALT